MPQVIMFLQTERELETRTHSIYDSVDECMEAICVIYKVHLMKLNPNVQIIKFKITQVFEFIDRFADIKCFVFQRNTRTYAPFNRMWIKQKIYDVLRRQAYVRH